MSGAELFLAAGAAQAIGSLLQGRQERALAEYNASLSDRNARIARQNARANEETFRRQSRREQGARRAAIGASGLRATGSALDVLADAAMEQELDALTIRYQGELEAAGFETQAAADRFRGRTAQRDALIGAGTSLLTGGARAHQAGLRLPGFGGG